MYAGMLVARVLHTRLSYILPRLLMYSCSRDLGFHIECEYLLYPDQ
jgi:hypothetical protein